ncbi:hypothetical protein SAICODRAFT_28173 [Saitoella complicata NRRL Y-17804]|uniref:Uncharacterized protein n=1 Tax=Saitoella complicata (strain BCRC 22490 / CBS 7301 / JCM 7358 / NBRC 10748 / NRRL Y-17804) TaxID=698492 RepID=A0A0E9NR41_SAICN|nr:uncharacterized protein SAICODRAFT_28173 [Saitoella complicata NRRL Y-17804]ODQ49685.1 hypothetical protein SAICODRAFT_28173 [Saitoella complicata NRRL Y-17804]GAO51865.1 hypothetical protein G7K_5956-t1 [Saitoella complicata NRRL Y-17804]
MSTLDSFRPPSPRTYRLALRDLTLPLLYAELAKLETSISHLMRSNVELQLYMGTEADGDGDGDCELRDAVKENEETIARMRSRMEICRVEIEEKGGGLKRCGESEEVQGEEGVFL